jgi:hypothetical protein
MTPDIETRLRQLAAENNQLRNQYDDLHDRTQEQVRRLEAEREALHHALNNLMALVRADYCDYNAWDAGILALIPGHRDGLGVTVAFAYEVERAAKRSGLPGHCLACNAMLTNGVPARPRCGAPPLAGANRMTVRDLIDELKSMDPDLLVVLAADATGNDYGELSGVEVNAAYQAGVVYYNCDPGTAKPCVVLWPQNH